MAAISLPRVIHISGGAIRDLSGALAQSGLARPFVVTDP